MPFDRYGGAFCSIKTTDIHFVGTDLARQMVSAYSWIARSLENRPPRAVFKTAERHHLSGSANRSAAR